MTLDAHRRHFQTFMKAGADALVVEDMLGHLSGISGRSERHLQ